MIAGLKVHVMLLQNTPKDVCNDAVCYGSVEPRISVIFVRKSDKPTNIPRPACGLCYACIPAA
jgi:hypothetical protein